MFEGAGAIGGREALSLFVITKKLRNHRPRFTRHHPPPFMFALLAAALSLHRVALNAAGGRLRLAGHTRHAVAWCSAARPKRHLEELAPLYYAEIDAAAFSNELLPHSVAIKWNPRLRRTAGRCLFLATRGGGSDGLRRAEIELSPRVLSTPDRLRMTLAHEMCHAMQWLVDGEARPPHGAAFQRWAGVLEQRCPEIGDVSQRCHTYEIETRFNYRCESCGQHYGRHSRLDLEKRRCGRCGGTLAAVEPKTHVGGSGGGGDRGGRAMPAFAAFVAERYGPLRRRWPFVTHQRLMQTLGRQWKRLPRKQRQVFYVGQQDQQQLVRAPGQCASR